MTETPTGDANANDNLDSGSAIGRRRDLAQSKGSQAYQQRRREIALAAGNVFYERGYADTTISDIAKGLETDRATLYYYFTNKQEIFDAVVSELAEADVTYAEQVQASAEPSLTKLRQLVTGLMNSYGEHYPLLYVYVRENLAAVGDERTVWSEQMRTVNRRYDTAVTAVVQEGLDDGTIRPLASARVLAFGIIGMVGWTNRWFAPDRSAEDAETIGAAYADMVVQGLATRPTTGAG
ncbi:MAG: TetR/AcrR family transcriptional regulator [Acidimicrobiaceae bacterium]|nr:TetR/AcrR family transcriptional regulator [Acidimicrobiaceae bacterium]MDA9241489.1 TetR/AcrR family transcriptional regulator [bacterium]HAY67517.1 TetR/AcrR family transcriptional regulator [Acidimicrobiaceae bacterium]